MTVTSGSALGHQQFLPVRDAHQQKDSKQYLFLIRDILHHNESLTDVHALFSMDSLSSWLHIEAIFEKLFNASK